MTMHPALRRLTLLLLLVFATLAVGDLGASAQGFLGGMFERRQRAPEPPPQAQPRYQAPPPAARGAYPAPPPPRGGYGGYNPGIRSAYPPGYRGQPVPPPPSALPPRGRANPPPQQAAAPPPQQEQRRGFFFGLFGGGGRSSDRPSGWPFSSEPPVEVDKPAQSAPQPARPARPAVEPTTFVLVIGDSIADQLATGLVEALDDKPEISIRRRIRSASGLAASDYDWPKGVVDLAANPKLNYVVVALGSNDTRPIRDGDLVLEPMSDAWDARYTAQVDALLAPFKERQGVKVFWVGLPPVKSETLSADLVAINELVKGRVEAAGGTYLDIWSGFVDEDNAYSQTGPDLQGRTVRLRQNDGIHFTRAGQLKLADYVAQEIRRDLEGGKPDEALPDAAAQEIARQPPRQDAGPMIVLTQPVKAPGGELVGATPAKATPEDVARVLVRGEPLAPVAGRMDDARWRPVPVDPVVATAPAPPPGAAGGGRINAAAASPP